MIGSKVRERRGEIGLSLQELATLTGLTPGFLSQLERDQTEPSITSLRKIAEALKVPIFSFLMDEERRSPLVRRQERRVLNLPGTGVTYELLSPPDFVNRKMEIVVTRMDPGVSGGDHAVTHPGEECIIVLRGQAAIKVAEEEYILDPGDSVYYYASLPHRISNCGDEELEFLAAITPPMF